MRRKSREKESAREASGVRSSLDLLLLPGLGRRVPAEDRSELAGAQSEVIRAI